MLDMETTCKLCGSTWRHTENHADDCPVTRSIYWCKDRIAWNRGYARLARHQAKEMRERLRTAPPDAPVSRSKNERRWYLGQIEEHLHSAGRWDEKVRFWQRKLKAARPLRTILKECRERGLLY